MSDMVQLLWNADVCLRSRPFISGIHSKCDTWKRILLVLKYSWPITKDEIKVFLPLYSCGAKYSLWGSQNFQYLFIIIHDTQIILQVLIEQKKWIYIYFVWCVCVCECVCGVCVRGCVWVCVCGVCVSVWCVCVWCERECVWCVCVGVCECECVCGVLLLLRF